MQIGIIGAGNLGAALTKRLTEAGHPVMLSFARDAEKLKATADSLGVASGTPAEAAGFAQVIILACPWVAAASVLAQTGSFEDSGKIIWDCTNPLKPDLSGLLIGTTTSAGEEVARLAPWARVVKAIPPFAELLHSQTNSQLLSRCSVFVCGDDSAARQVITGLVRQIGADPVDCGPLNLARYTEPAGMLLVQLAYRQGFGPGVGLLLLREDTDRPIQGD